jgi:hypothetical protein
VGVPFAELLQCGRDAEVHAERVGLRPWGRTLRLNGIGEALARQRRHVDHLVDEFVAAGYRLEAFPDDGPVVLFGEDEINGRSQPFEIRVWPEFPYSPPKVRPADGAGGGTWHQESDGTLCLWDTERTQPEAWASRDSILDRVRSWYDQAAKGWPDDAPDMDLDRYWELERGLVLYGDLPARGWVRMKKDVRPGLSAPVWEVKGAGNSTKRNHSAGFVIDIGEPDQPPRTIGNLFDLAHEPELQTAIDRRHVGWIVVRYHRRGNAGVLVLHLSYGAEVTGAAIAAAGTSQAVRQLRAGHASHQLSEAQIAIVGLGGIGSFVADELARAGVRSISLFDPDVLVPGNLVRHVLDADVVGFNKAQAMVRHLTWRRSLDPADVKAYPASVGDLAGAAQVLESHDLVVNATGNVSTTRAFDDAAELLGKSVVTVATTQDGRVVRVDRSPLSADETWAPDPSLPPTTEPPIFDRSCGSPVSPTPPWAVTLAASHATRAVVALLTCSPTPPSYVQTIDVSQPPDVHSP